MGEIFFKGKKEEALGKLAGCQDKPIKAPPAPAPKIKLVPMPLAGANRYIEDFHRHHKKVQGHKYSLGAACGSRLAGVCVVGRPVARALDDGDTVEVTRLCTDGTKNACSFLYAAAANAAKALGYGRIGTYILDSESGVTLRAAGWMEGHVVRGKSWSCPSRPRKDKHPTVNKKYWYKDLKERKHG